MKHQRGYNIVEIGIVLAVSLMMASWLFVNYFQVDNDARNKQAERAIVAIQTAMVGYAADSAAKSYQVINEGATLKLRWRLPVGRPYLPCPDISGDGLEDRRPFLSGGLLTVSASLAIGNQLEAGGDCYRDRGLVPWKTLGVPRHDPWGNFYTYRVGGNFSNAVVGFDQDTRSDQASYTRLLSPLTLAAGNTVAMRATIPQTLVARPAPATGDAFLVWGGDINNYYAPSVVCENAPCGAAGTVSVIVGEFVSAPVTAATGGYHIAGGAYAVFAAPDIINGLPIVIVSHGKNGHGAVYRERNDLYCRPLPPPPPPGTVPPFSLGEAQNAYWAPDDFSNINNSDCTDAIMDVHGMGGRQNGFVSHPRTKTFDDVVGWMSTGRLVDALEERGVFPVELLPPLGLEDY